MKIILVRHGQSEINVINRKSRAQNKGQVHGGHCNWKLTEEGINQAIELKNNPYISKMQKIYSSDLQRAMETLMIATKNKSFTVDKRLREIYLGDFEGKNDDDLRNEYSYFYEKYGSQNFANSFDIKIPNAENYVDVVNRCLDFLNQFNLEENITIGIFSHCCLIRCFLYCLMDISKENTINLWIENCKPIVLSGNKLHEFELIQPQIDFLIRS